MDDKFIKTKKKSYTLFIILTCLLCLGILLLMAGVLILTLAKMMGLSIPFIILGCACTLAGMYGAPSAKTNYRTYLKYEVFIKSVNEEGIKSREILMNRLNMSEDAFDKMVNYCIKNEFIKEIEEKVETEEKHICPNCGKEIPEDSEMKFCPYCGGVLKGEENE
ncbi:MAG: zinc ribbon domain-containing protein [Clostridia bacterium]|nr:zinc ribbon domain-containing protein [Clostridia bacterium]